MPELHRLCPPKVCARLRCVYRERFPDYDSYESYITRVTCNCIVHTHFLAPNVTWQVVKFGATA